MLVLTRSFGERVVITVEPGLAPTEIIVTFTGIRNGKARIGFDAPDHVEVNREEVQVAIERTGRRA